MSLADAGICALMLLVHTDANDIELKSALEQLLLNLRRDAVETNVTLWKHGRSMVGGRSVLGVHHSGHD